MFQGLAKSDSSNCVIDGNGPQGCWWNCAGSTKGFRCAFIPGPNGKKAPSLKWYLMTNGVVTTTATTLPGDRALLRQSYK
eukprot:2415543-Amphidinium_carterae.1